MKSFQFTIDGRKYETTVNEIEDNIAEVTVNGTVFHVAIDKKKTTPSIKPVEQPRQRSLSQRVCRLALRSDPVVQAPT